MKDYLNVAGIMAGFILYCIHVTVFVMFMFCCVLEVLSTSRLHNIVKIQIKKEVCFVGCWMPWTGPKHHLLEHRSPSHSSSIHWGIMRSRHRSQCWATLVPFLPDTKNAKTNPPLSRGPKPPGLFLLSCNDRPPTEMHAGGHWPNGCYTVHIQA